jgi:hypothetical protein
MAGFGAVDMDEILSTVTSKLAQESTSYGALQYLQSFVARKRKQLGLDNTSIVVFHGAECLINNGHAQDAGNALQWYIQSQDLFHLDVSVTSKSTSTSSGSHYCDSLRLLNLFKKFQSNNTLHKCASVVYDPFHTVVVESKSTSGRNANSEVTKRMKEFDEVCANVFENAGIWRSAYRVCIRLNLVDRAAIILDKWSNDPATYAHEKPLFFCRSILTLLSENKMSQAVAMVNCSKKLLKGIDNSTCDPPRPGQEDSAHLACWHFSVIITELAYSPPAARVDKKRLFRVLTDLYAEMMDRIDSRLVQLIETIGKTIYEMDGPKKQDNVDPMNMLQAMMSAGGNGGANNGKKGSKGPLGGMDPQQLLAMMNSMGK